MSGSSGTFRPIGLTTPCEKLQFETVLQSPNPAVLESLQVGDELQVVLQVTGTAKTVRVLRGRTVAGTIIGTAVQKLIECLENGYTYAASVRSVSAGRCEVRVSRK